MIRKLEFGGSMGALLTALLAPRKTAEERAILRAQEVRDLGIRDPRAAAPIPQPRTPDPMPAPDLPKPREGR